MKIIKKKYQKILTKIKKKMFKINIKNKNQIKVIKYFIIKQQRAKTIFKKVKFKKNKNKLQKKQKKINRKIVIY